ncbi:MAG: DUF488 family protein [Rhodobacteraceae bacterium]|nr:DUF488 family protein [Paracoccaceae bacterium]MCB1478765.1 DUF488 family protein [Rhodobiaceae bacterium]
MAESDSATLPDRGDHLRVKRIYRAARVSDGRRILVDRIWPRGMAKDRARIHDWAKEIAPSDGLRRWFHANPDRWEEFGRRYRGELDGKRAELGEIAEFARSGVVTLLYGSKDEAHNNAVVLRDCLLELLETGGTGDE